MKMQKLVSLLLFAVMALGTATVSYAVEIILELEGIEGESRVKGFEKDIDVLSYSFGAHRAGTMHTGSTSDRAGFKDLQVVKYVDKASPLLMYAVATGKRYTKGSLVVRHSGDNPLTFYQLDFENAMITSYEQGGSSPDGPTETISVNFGKVLWKYWPANRDGSRGTEVRRGWDIMQNIKY